MTWNDKLFLKIVIEMCMCTLAEFSVGAIFSDSGLLLLRSSVTHWGRGLDAKHQLWSSVWRESLGGKEPRKLQQQWNIKHFLVLAFKKRFQKKNPPIQWNEKIIQLFSILCRGPLILVWVLVLLRLCMFNGKICSIF